ncbi:YbaB/EbfC family nucleoid-associated protein [Thermomonospora catenispora]|uniref:YbaB/EbfC family nucleoid-associated protein n=1 Tax=Thermomonospora catenispora TaxID=2493090 RepID=UPI001121032C|nr:YbaB/EbfC family nucleoid-associated protein [Thermomonospora catenispora]TNY36601.1 YbaB/EbfC family DNA-binding protein [Thermomonospora catenispora]
MNEFDFGEFLRASERQAAKSQELTRKSAELVGRAESPDGRVEVEWTHERGLAGLRIGPRAMRSSSTELAELIVTTAQVAEDDLRAQADALTEELFGPDGDPLEVLEDPEAVQDKIKELQDGFHGTLQDATALPENLRRTLGR